MSKKPRAASEPTEAEAIEAAVDAAAQAVRVQTHELEELVGGGPAGASLTMERLLDVSVEVTVLVGSARITFGELVRLGPGSLIELDREAHEPADILVNDKVVAKGEIVTVGETYGVRVLRVES